MYANQDYVYVKYMYPCVLFSYVDVFISYTDVEFICVIVSAPGNSVNNTGLRVVFFEVLVCKADVRG